MNQHYEVIIVGGGLVGASLACALAGKPISTAIIERRPIQAQQENTKGQDPRSTVLTDISRRFFQALNMWDKLQNRVSKIKHIHVSSLRHFGFTELHSQQTQTPALGYVIDNAHLQAALWDRIHASGNIDVISPASLEGLKWQNDLIQLSVNHTGTIAKTHCPLLVAADGMNSEIRKYWNIPLHTFDYGQTAIVASISVERPRLNWAFEKMTRDGPLALLPRSDGSYALIWCMAADLADQFTRIEEKSFLQHLQSYVGRRLGKLLATTQRFQFPIRMILAVRNTQRRCVLMGNAAHNLHPVAGQSFNLALREIARLTELLIDAKNHGRDLGAKTLLSSYAKPSLLDQNQIASATHALVRSFNYHLPGVNLMRNTAMLALDHCLPLKTWLTHKAMGGFNLPRLSQGIPLT